uniref:Uncharacterized protein n=1 Tax=Octopus bimaculoides TaxID=37653 RepID=A0A0L8HQI8_OCTBM
MTSSSSFLPLSLSSSSSSSSSPSLLLSLLPAHLFSYHLKRFPPVTYSLTYQTVSYQLHGLPVSLILQPNLFTSQLSTSLHS